MRKWLPALALFAAGTVLAAGAVWTAFPPEFALQSLLTGAGSEGLSICDPDLDNDLLVNLTDLQGLRDAFHATASDPRWNEDADFNGDGAIDFLDDAIMRSLFFGAPGPSALKNPDARPY